MQMKQLLNEWRNFILLEESGAQWTVYHTFGKSLHSQVAGTKDIGSLPGDEQEVAVKKRIKTILTNGFVPGESKSSHGKGLYAFLYYPEGMNYGKFTLQFRVNLNGFIILIPWIAEKVYGKYHSLKDQLKLLGYNYQNPRMKKFIEQEERLYHDENLSQEFADFILNKSEIKPDGIVYQGMDTGDSLVGYNLEKFNLIGWSMEPLESTPNEGEDTRPFYGDENMFKQELEAIANNANFDPKLFIKLVRELVPVAASSGRKIIDLLSGKEKLQNKWDVEHMLKTANNDQSTLDRFFEITRNADFSFLSKVGGGFSKKLTKFHKDIDGIPLRDFWSVGYIK